MVGGRGYIHVRTLCEGGSPWTVRGVSELLWHTGILIQKEKKYPMDCQTYCMECQSYFGCQSGQLTKHGSTGHPSKVRGREGNREREREKELIGKRETHTHTSS